MQAKANRRPVPATSSAPAEESAAAKSIEPHEDEIRERAREIYLIRAGSGWYGDAISDWLQAERELRNRNTNA